MRVYYNEWDKPTAQWLRNLSAAGQVSPGIVDERDIRTVRAADVSGYERVHFFAGIGGWDYALAIAGWPERREVWTASCPCQPFSTAGKGQGEEDPRHLWPATFRLIRECRPATVFGEQVADAIEQGWIDRVFDDLEGEGYACGQAVLPACGVGAPEVRKRLYWVADAAGERGRRRDALEAGRGQEPRGPGADILRPAWPDHAGRSSTLAVTDVCAPSYGLPGRVGRLRAYGNSIVPQVAAEFIKAFLEAEQDLAKTSNHRGGG